MSQSIVNDMLTPEEAVRGDVRCICFVLDDDMIKGLQRLKEILGFPIGVMIADPLRQLINTFLPLADLYEQGKLTLGCIPDFMKGIESLVLKVDVAKARLDKKVKKLEKQKTMELRSKK